jgi:hypothetical protein
MPVTPVHRRNLDHAILQVEHDASLRDRCGHGKTWDQDCPDCASVWRADRIKDLHKQAAKYGFELVPTKPE